MSIQNFGPSIRFKSRDQKYSTFTKALAGLIMLSFLIQLFTHIIRSNTLLAIFFLLISLIMILTKAKIMKLELSISSLWLLAFAALIFSFSRTEFDINVYTDIVAFFSCIIMLLCCGSKKDTFALSLKVIRFFAIFYGISIWIQILFPFFYRVYLTFLPERSANSIVTFQNNITNFTGFSSNPAYTAGHLVAGILLLITGYRDNISKRSKRREVYFILFLFISLLMTGKRAHLLFLLCSFAVIYLVPSSINKKLKKINYLIIALLTLVALFFALKDFLVAIPAFARIVETIDGLINGVDVTNNRNILYKFGWQLFFQNPWFGVGWGNYRNNTVGNVTQIYTIDTHNIYLQMLCEMGVVGFLFMIIPMIAFFVSTCHSTKRAYKNKYQHIREWNSLLFFSLGYQTFFLLYGMTGNPLYDYNFLLLYFFSCSICIAYKRCERKEKVLLSLCNVI